MSDTEQSDYVDLAKAKAVELHQTLDADGYTVVHAVEKILKRSARITLYSILKLPDDERPTPTIALRTQTVWTRVDGKGTSEEPEYHELPSYKLVQLIQQYGEKK